MRNQQGKTPPEVAELIKDLIENKTVCDVGCGEGNFMLALSKYAKKVVGIEEQEELCDEVIEKGLDVYCRNVFFFPLPEADVYYCWTKDAMGVYLKAKWEGTKGKFIFGMSQRESTIKFIASLNPEIREINNFKVYITEL